jgi:hypothetical protein
VTAQTVAKAVISYKTDLQEVIVVQPDASTAGPKRNFALHGTFIVKCMGVLNPRAPADLIAKKGATLHERD